MPEVTGFFDDQSEKSRIKTLLVTKYFGAWVRVMKSVTSRSPRSSGKLNYIDLFSGPGRYASGEPSTPLIILQAAIDDEYLCNHLVTLFNDSNPAFANALREEVERLDGIRDLKYPPQILNYDVGNEIADYFATVRLNPTLIFIDPWGYRGLSLRLISSAIKDFGSDCIFFFNYNRINMALSNEKVFAHVCSLLGDSRAEQLRSRIEHLDPDLREYFIVDELVHALRETGLQYVLPFRFRGDAGLRTSHHLVFVSKNVLGYSIMKELMAELSSEQDQGVASFEYNPVSHSQLPLLSALNRPLDSLGDELLDHFRGQTLTMKAIYESHHVDTPFIKKNYKDVLRMLEQDDQILCDKPASARRKVTKGNQKGMVSFGDNVVVTFPS